jgi:YegS/Rv2252/BmrU family lipid kinase
MSNPTVGVVINEGKSLAGDGLEELRAALADADCADPPWREVPKSKKAPSAVKDLVENHGVDRLLVWGGDGTVRRCISTLLRDDYDDVTVGVLPAGTGNLLAHNLGIPVDLRGAVDIALHGDPRPIDVGVVNSDQHFVVMAGTGFDALLIEEADESGLKDRFGKLGYVWAGFRHRHVSPARARVTVDGEPWYTGAVTTVVIGNVGRLIGGLPAFPDAEPEDGRLDVGVVEVRSASEWVRLFGAAMTHRVGASPLARVATASEITIELDRTLPWQVDGGDRDRLNSFDIKCLPGAIRVCQPHLTA